MDAFEEHRARLLALAYRMTGSRADAEDLVSECWLRWAQANKPPSPSVPHNPGGWLTTVLVRLCLDHQKSAQQSRTHYIGPWLPEPLRTDEPAHDALDHLALTESISTAFLLVLENLSPSERAVLLLHDVFDYEHDEIATMLGRTANACRQSLHRARAHLRENRPRFAPSREQHAAVLQAFSWAIATGDTAQLTSMFAADSVILSDSNGKALAARNPVRGADPCARMLIGLARKSMGEQHMEFVQLNGWPALVLRVDDQPVSALAIETDGTKVFAVYIVRNPEKLLRL
ncbi:MAG: RNA polymerase sigma factor SigJ [Deltaproteobacteria bacterium]|nr:RNA polymerase sigma factor SigJ [Deltaproteobacteria bacterium]